MSYYLDLFSPETHLAFSHSDRAVSGFRVRQRSAAERIKPGDKLVCYITRISRWIGLLQVETPFFENDAPIFYGKDDPFTIRFKVKPLVWLDQLDAAIPIHDPTVWETLSITKSYDPSGKTWTGPFRASLNKMTEEDGRFLETRLLAQIDAARIRYPLSNSDQRLLKRYTIRREDDSLVPVTVPVDDDEDETEEPTPPAEKHESKKMQALIAQIGERMGLKIWLPRSDRGRVLEYWTPAEGSLLDGLPLNYDETTIDTIEQIDVLWLRRRSIVRAFEVEHTTSIHSGILRMADLMALQPNLLIRAHIVAPIERKEKVLREIARPVFSFLEKGPLSNLCTYISYDSLIELSKERLLEDMKESVLERYVEEEDT